MPRRREVPKREILPDPVYNSQLVTKFINSLMSQGRKSVAERVFYNALKKVEDRAKDDPIKLFKKAVDNVKPALEVKSRRVGGSNYQVPIEVRPSRRTGLEAARTLPEEPFIVGVDDIHHVLQFGMLG